MDLRIYGLLFSLWALPVYAQQVLFQEEIDPTGAFPAGWQTRFWATTDQTPSPGSGGFSFVLRGRQAGRLCTPVFNARTASLDTLSYLARRTGSYPALHLIVRASTDGGHTFAYVVAAAGEALPASDGRWAAMRFPLPPSLSGTSALQLCFEAPGGNSSSARLQLDDVTLHGTGTLRPWPLAVQPVRVDAGFVAVGDTVALSFLLRNQTDSTLSVALPPLSPPWQLMQSTVMLSPRQTDTLTLYVAPTRPDTFLTTWPIPLQDDTLFIPLRVTAIPPVRYLGWSLSNLAVRARDTVRLGLQLQLDDSAPDLQGLLLTARLPQRALAYLALEPGASLPDPARWTLQTAQQGDTLRVLLLGSALQRLPAGSYPELLRLRLVPADVSDTVQLRLMLHGLEATAATPEAPSVALALHPRRLQLTVRPRVAQAVLTPDTLRLPATPVGTRRSATAYLSNPGGERTLHARIRPAADPTLTVSPDSVAVAPDDTVRITVTFEPTLRNFGWRVATVRIQHDGSGSDSLLTIEATGTGGLGDPTEEGAVDVADLQRGIRYVLGLEEPEAQDRLVLDVAPFPHGDGWLRLNDLSVLVQAIVRNAWPDGHPLPTPPPLRPPAGEKQNLPLVLYLIAEGSSQTRLEIEAPRPFGALQLVLPPALYDTIQQALPPNARLQVGRTLDRLTLVLYRFDGVAFPSGRYRLGTLQAARADTLRPLRWVAVDETGRYLPTATRIANATSIEPAPRQPRVFPPYPQPFFPSRHTALVLAGTLPTPSTFTLEVFDLLGRRLTYRHGHFPAGAFQYRWDARNAQGRLLPSGLYLLRLRIADVTRTFPIVILH